MNAAKVQDLSGGESERSLLEQNGNLLGTNDTPHGTNSPSLRTDIKYKLMQLSASIESLPEEALASCKQRIDSVTKFVDRAHGYNSTSHEAIWRRSGRDTDIDAAISQTSESLTQNQHLALQLIIEHAGLTDQELSLAANRPKDSIAPRRVNLMHKGFVVDSGKRRATRSGHSAIVWVATAAGKSWFDANTHLTDEERYAS